MFKKVLVTMACLSAATAAYADNPTIRGTVASKCSVYTTTQGVYGNPSPDVLSTAAAAGGVQPIVRYDVAIGDYYYGKITYPTSFTSSPTLTTSALEWTGEVDVSQVSVPAMSAYTNDVVTYDNTYQYDLTEAGSTWFKVSSVANYGYNQAFPAGSYVANVVAECIAK
jgi:hypothetical protein